MSVPMPSAQRLSREGERPRETKTLFALAILAPPMQSEALFPLTPALSPRERETRTPALEHEWRTKFVKTLPSIPPLPWRGPGVRGNGVAH